jgi:hypothetical protein
VVAAPAADRLGMAGAVWQRVPGEPAAAFCHLGVVEGRRRRLGTLIDHCQGDHLVPAPQFHG